MVVTRIAPSPTGDPHVGTAYIALFNWAYAKKKKGKFILRIEDTDVARKVPGAEEKILEALSWLGFSWDEGPIRQSERLEIYRKHALDLVEKDKAYFCFCREERLERLRAGQRKKGLPPRYDGLCRKIDPKESKDRSAKESHVIRLKVPEEGSTAFTDLIRGEIAFENKEIDDQILLKSDGYPTYHLAVVVDDHLLGITHVVRGEEWISSTPKHVLLYQAFGWDLPKFAHLPLLREKDKSKLSKRHGAVSILEFREQGYLPEALLNFLALLGWSHPEGKDIFTLDEFVEKFSFERFSTSAPTFDREKLDWMNGEYIRQLKIKNLKLKIKEYLEKYQGKRVDDQLLEKTTPLVQERIKKLSEFWEISEFFFEEPRINADSFKPLGLPQIEVREFLGTSLDLFESKEIEWDYQSLHKALEDFALQKGWQKKDLFMALRITTTGRAVSPPLFESMEVLGREKVLERIEKATQILRVA